MLTRHPRLGEVKTRLAAYVGDEAALALHRRLAEHTLRQLLALEACAEARVEVRTDAAFVHATREWLGKGPRYRYQGEGDLGSRLATAFADAFRRGYRRAIVVGSDCPRLAAADVRRALVGLEDHDVVLGPAADGGYYLIGLSRPHGPRALGTLFNDVPWGSSDVLRITVNHALNAGLSVEQLDELSDVDRPEDLPDAEAALKEMSPDPAGRISVIIPALDDAELVGAAVRSALTGGAQEAVVVDGGSTDATREVAASAGATVLHSPRGRARQMNAGALSAQGDVLCFLHADSVLPPAFPGAVRTALGEAGAVAASFDFGVPRHGVRDRLISGAGNLRWRLTRLPYGDQALCVPRPVFEALGGFPQMPAMEDYEFSLRLRRYGKIARIGDTVRTSARTWDEYGLIRPTVVNGAVIFGYRLGVSPQRLAGWRASIAPKQRREGPDG